MKPIRSILKRLFSGRFSLLLLTLGGMFFLVPLIPSDTAFLDDLLGVFSLVVLLSCLRSITQNQAVFSFMVALALLNLAAGSFELLGHTHVMAFQVSVLGMRLLYYGIVFVSIMRYVFDQTSVTVDKICGAVSAYILMGLIFAVIYSIFFIINPGSFSFPQEVTSDSLLGLWSIYYSFVTLTTLGYGDVTPVLPAAQVYSFVEAACGQLFLGILVARLIALQILHSRAESGRE